MDIVWNNDDEVRAYSFRTFDDLVTCEMLRHGMFSNGSTLLNVRRVYDELFLEAPVDRRREIYEHVKMIVSATGGRVAAAFTPFMNLDDDPGIVATATIDYISFGPLIEGDPMSRPKDVLEMVIKGVPRNRAAVIGGLISVGDPRVCALVAPLRGSLNIDEAEIVTQAFTGMASKSQVSFYLDWLEELVDDQDDDTLALFGHVAAGLHRLAARRIVPFITDGLRPFPVPGQDDETGWSDMRAIDPDEFADSISGRLYDLERRESFPKVMPHAIRAFGLTPRTPPEEIASIQ
ncbi:MAG TPA: hypothetical protein VNS34_14120 [Rhizobiaceae bacterium]|nr:hypothetical protein [Rhizobiaceae bacterium]